MNKIEVHKSYVGLDQEMNEIIKFVKTRFMNMYEEGGWLHSRNIPIEHEIVDHSGNWAMEGMVVFLYVNLTDEQASEYLMRFK